jgi:DNA (cytosine-5)-methyltransferase 1
LSEKRVVGTYIDLFAGCGGLSLGLGDAGWKGIFAVEKDDMAFSTFKHNLIDGKFNHFNWPSWLPQKETTIQELLGRYPDKLASLNGKVDLIAGGPPCQGFSLAGKRNPNDKRNRLASQYIRMVELIKPKYLILENVRGFNATFSSSKGKISKIPQSILVKERLEKTGYTMFIDYVNSQDFGVPQQRQRFFMIGIRSDIYLKGINPFEMLNDLKPRFLKRKGLSQTPVSVKMAIGDLEVEKHSLIVHSGSPEKGFMQIKYNKPQYLNSYLQLMRKGMDGTPPNSLRLARHKEETVNKFKLIHKICRPGVSLSATERERVGTKKQALTVLDAEAPSKTLTTLPDDLLHYSELRILTVRENARIQSFPDNFEFLGRYTTGGVRRTKECPRYTQVGNAVPPFLGEALGILISTIDKKLKI